MFLTHKKHTEQKKLCAPDAGLVKMSSASMLAELRDMSSVSDSSDADTGSVISLELPKILTHRHNKLPKSIFAIKQSSGEYAFIQPTNDGSMWMQVEQPRNPGTSAIWLPNIHPCLFLTNSIGAFRAARAATNVQVVIAADSVTVGKVHTETGGRRFRSIFASASTYPTTVRSVIVNDSTQIDPKEFYLRFYESGTNLLEAFEKTKNVPVVVACAAGMNRSCTTIIFASIIRAFQTPSPSFAKLFGSGPFFSVKNMVRHLREENEIGRYPVLTNLWFVELLERVHRYWSEDDNSGRPRGVRMSRHFPTEKEAQQFKTYAIGANG
jgi:hypothetical protein